MVPRNPGTIGTCLLDALYQNLGCGHSIDPVPPTMSHLLAGKDIQTFGPLTIGSLVTRQNDTLNLGMPGTISIVPRLTWS